MAAKANSRPNQRSVTINPAAGDFLRFTVEVSGAQGTVVIATSDATILKTPVDPSGIQSKYVRTWKPAAPSGTKFRAVSAVFTFPVAVSYEYKVEVVNGPVSRVVKHVTVKQGADPETTERITVILKS